VEVADAELPVLESLSADKYVQRAIIASNIANLLLLLCQMYAYVSTKSLALLANAVDAVLDFLSGIIIGLTWYVRHYGSTCTTRYRYPVGRARLESVGVIIMAVLMTALTLNVLTESLTSLALYVMDSQRAIGASSLKRPVLVLVSIALLSKVGLFLYCRASQQDAVSALATDHWNDCLSNIGALSAAALAKWWPPADPVGGILISCFILRNWWRLTSRHLDQFMSRSASSNLHSVVTFAALWHDPRIRAIDRVCLYHVGPACFAEVDIVLDPNMPLAICHDIGESLQARIECLPDVERCFVHLDFETAHRTDVEHQWPV
jgi:cation diffusion facilitator family transporter